MLIAASSQTNSSLRRSPALWLLIGIFAVEFFLFDQFGARRYTGIYPRWDDQVQYLSESYIAYERSRADGFAAALKYALLHPSAQGTLHDVGALFAFTIAGPSRSAALALNMLALIAWQFALFLAVARQARSNAFGIAAALLPLALVGPWENIPGSAYDFRLDHLTMCALGVTSAIAWLTEGFRARGPSLLFGAAVGLTLLTRFLSGTYLALIFAGMIAWACAQPDRRQRIVNLVLSGFVALILAGPVLWLSRERVVEYYWIGHFVGPESAVRDARLGVMRSVGYVFQHLAGRHVGVFFGCIALLGLVAFRIMPGARARLPAGHWIIASLFLIAPAVVFTLHRQKSEVVLSALVPGLVLLVIAAWARLRGVPATNLQRAMLVPTALALLMLGFFVQRQLRRAYDPATLTQFRQFNQLTDTLFARVTSGAFAEPGIAVDHLNDALHAEVLRVIFYERHRVWLPIKMTLPTGVVEPAADDVMNRLMRSHLVMLTNDPAPAGRYPYDEKLSAMRTQIRAWCEAHLRQAESFSLFGRSMTLYQRPEIPFAAPRP